jgi:HipA-like protein
MAAGSHLKKLKIVKEDEFGLLLTTCADGVGAVEIQPDTEA